MVFDATARVFNLSESAEDHSSRASTSAAAPPALPGSTRPTKRRRTTQSGALSSTPASSPAPTPILDLDALDAARRRAAGRVMSLWESLAEKYARPIEDDDEIDILTGKICKDRGVLRSVSERGWKIGSFGEALEVEPLVLVSEGETETGTSEADDEGEGEDDTEGEGADDTEEGGEDPLGGWSYDWQYRVLPPPRPELSPQDAEDLKEFLATEHAIQENRRKNGKQPEPEDDDDIVYLGDSLHNIDGTLRGDETSDDEFASMAITDNSTIRYMKHEDEDEDEDGDADDIEPMASILGALALGKTPTKQALRRPSPLPKNEDMDNKCAPFSNLPRDNAPAQSYSGGGPQADTTRPIGSSTTIGFPGLDVDDDLIIIDSDSDDESEPVDSPRLKPGAPPSTFPKQIQRVSSGVLATNSPFTPGTPSYNPTTQSIQTPKISHTGEASLSKPPTTQKSPSNIKRAPPLPGSPVPKTPITKKSTSKRTLAELTSKLQTPGSRVTTTSNHPHKGILDSCSSTTTSSTPARKPSNRATASNSHVKSPSKQLHQTEAPLRAAKRKPTTSGTDLREKPALGQSTAASLGSPPKVLSPRVPTSAPTGSPSSSTRAKSPVKRRKKATVVEVVLPILKHTPKVKRELTAPPPSAVSKSTAPATTASASNKHSHSQSDDSAPSSAQLDPTPANTHSIPHTSLVIRSGVEPRPKRKRSSDGAELAPNVDSALESRVNVGSVGPGPGPLHVCCPSTPLGQNQLAVCCPAHSQYPSGPHLHAHTPQSTHSSCSTHAHPVYQYQHQHQHLHTHLPYPLPQLPFTANELTEAAFKLIQGLSTYHQASGASGSPGAGFWLPGAQLPFGFAIPSQAGPSSQSIPPKLEEPSSQENISNECIPSSQEHERKAEAMINDKPSQIFPSLPHPEDPASVAPDALFETRTDNKPTIASAATLSGPSNSNPQPFEREMSVIDIESDSDDEFAVCDAGAGSMRWEPPIKKEAGLYVEGPKNELAPRKSSVNSRVPSPTKLKGMP
ncbi:unnamed protein product [Rhizoctonia solani]|uniref:Centromere protein Scm3 n=1 Tax=Rhizoctonia solani TaxID=456999 RepID=A0A8H3DQ95_9AGAM|nr:unnamed protein product [Rhizoctonia solani]